MSIHGASKKIQKNTYTTQMVVSKIEEYAHLNTKYKSEDLLKQKVQTGGELSTLRTWKDRRGVGWAYDKLSESE